MYPLSCNNQMMSFISTREAFYSVIDPAMLGSAFIGRIFPFGKTATTGFGSNNKFTKEAVLWLKGL